MRVRGVPLDTRVVNRSRSVMYFRNSPLNASNWPERMREVVGLMEWVDRVG